jgi:hypothetical protein
LVFWKQKFDSVFKGQRQIFVHKSIVNKKPVYREVFIHPIYFEGKIIEASAIAQDITEPSRKKEPKPSRSVDTDTGGVGRKKRK